MSSIKLSPNASGTGEFTIAAPNSNTNRTLTLPDATGTIQVSGNPISGTTGTFTGLLDISAAGAGQIQFPATQNASSNANTLDDYEEGTFNITMQGSISNPTYTDLASICHYTKIGNTVLIQGRVSFSSVSGGSGNIRFSGFPFAGNGSASWQTLSLGYRAAATNVVPLAMMIPQGATYAEFWKSSSTTNPQAAISASILAADVATSVEFYFGGTYTTS